MSQDDRRGDADVGASSPHYEPGVLLNGKTSDSVDEVLQTPEASASADPSGPARATTPDASLGTADVASACAGSANTGGELHPYEMSLSLNVINHLGIHLYSNLPAVLSEAVANAWDADATKVQIDVDPASRVMTIIDNGIGMTPTEVNARYLRVGYKRREDPTDPHGQVTRAGRPVMGRKGIGKLSLFSIAKTVEVRSTAFRPDPFLEDNLSRSHAGLLMDVDDIEDQISNQNGSGTYYPEPLPDDDILDERGTSITLRRPKKDLARTSTFLRRRLARRFSTRATDFEIVLDGRPISVQDRDIYDKCRYVWIFGTDAEMAQTRKLFGPGIKIVELTGSTDARRTVSGWIGSAETSTALKPQSSDDESLNRIAVLVRNKLAQEDVLGLADQGGLFTKFLTGELYVDWLDDNDVDDIATSSRQGLMEDDDRFRDLRGFLSKTVRKIGTDWNDFREEDGLKDASADVPAITEWIDTFSGDTKRAARSFVGKINAAAVDRAHRKQLLVSGVVAFERLQRRDRLSAIEATDEANLPALLAAFEGIDDIEAAMYYDLIKQRLEIIEKFADLVEEKPLESVLQKYLFEHLWLLDPGWDRATVPVMEKAVSTLIEDKSASADRVDIKYRTSGTNHIIVELKKAERTVDTFELLEQVDKYRDPVQNYLRDTHALDVELQIVCVVGRELRDWRRDGGRARSRAAMSSYNVRVLLYDQLIRQARQTYAEFLEENRSLGEIRSIVERIESSLVAPETNASPAPSLSP